MSATLTRSLASILDITRQRLASVSDTPGLDAQVLLAYALGKPRAWLLAHPEVALTPAQSDFFESLLTRLEQGEPLPYVLGQWEFYGLDFTVTPAVLIPRPETELLVEQALGWLHQHPQRRLAADAGTGSGCIAVTLAVHIPDLQVIATDISSTALAVARANAEKHRVAERLHFVQSDLLSCLATVTIREKNTGLQSTTSKPFDLICANLPYIPSSTLHQLEVFGKEPATALDGGLDGLDLLRRFLPQARERLATNGFILIEMEASQGEAMQILAQRTFPRSTVQVLPDLAGHDRLVSIQG